MKWPSEQTWKAAALAAVPDGYGVVGSGDVQPDDLAWSIAESKWRRADDPEWVVSTIGADAADLICVVRRAVHAIAAGQSTRRYVLKPAPAETPVASGELFDDV